MKNKFQQILQQMKEQEWYQQIQGAFQQLSPEQQSYVKWGGVSAIAIAFMMVTWNVMSTSNEIKNDYYQKLELSQTLSNGSDELRRLKGQSSGISQASTDSWKRTLENLVVAQGMTPDSIEILKEAPGAAQNIIQEVLLEVKIKGIQIQPLVMLLFQMEHSQPPMKLKGMSIETGTEDLLLNAKLNLSGYVAKEGKSK